mgnify:CR=1 FL=1
MLNDTPPELRQRQVEIHRGMSPGERLGLACELTDLARELALAGIRRDHPDWSEAQARREILRRAFLPEPLPPWLPRIP